MLKTFTLKNGIKVATYHLPALKSIHLRACIKAGSIVDDQVKSGLAHFMEHMLVQGIPSFPNVEEFSGYIESLAGNYSATTQLLQVNFLITLPFGHLEDSIRIASEVFFEPIFVENAIEKERRAVLEEIKQRMDSHYYKINQFIKKTSFKKDHPLTRENGGTIDTVNKLTRDDMLGYWKKYFLPSNTYLIITGNFDEEKLIKLLNEYFERYPNRKSPKIFPPLSSADFNKRQVALRHDSNLQQNYIDFSFPTASLDEPKEIKIAHTLLTTILGGLRNSRLFKLLRYQKGLVYDVSAGAVMIPGLGYGYISSEASNENLEEVIELIVKETAAFIKNGPTQAELEFARNYLGNQWLMTFDHPSAIAGWLESGLLWSEEVLLPEDYISIMKDFTIEQLTEIMRKYWDFGKLILSVQGAIENTAEKKKQLIKLTAPLK